MSVFRAVKGSLRTGINVRRHKRGEVWQDRFFDQKLGTVNGKGNRHPSPFRPSPFSLEEEVQMGRSLERNSG